MDDYPSLSVLPNISLIGFANILKKCFCLAFIVFTLESRMYKNCPSGSAVSVHVVTVRLGSTFLT